MSETKLNRIEIDTLIARLTAEKSGKDVKMTQLQIKSICQMSRSIFLSQPSLLQLQAPLQIVGDIHGQFTDLLRIFDYNGFPPETNYLFLGDYVDRGKQSVETMTLLLLFKIKYPENFFVLRGNHQCAQVNRLYGFYDQCKNNFMQLWKNFTDCFNTMPVAALVGEKILCMHGGISPQLTSLQQLISLPRPIQIPSEGILCDVLWSDPTLQKGWRQNKQRGISYLFGSDVLAQFLKTHDLDLICRSHQIVEEGYQFFGKRQLVTIFSAPNYCGQFQNWGAVMNVNKHLICSFHVIKHDLKKQKQGISKIKPKIQKFVT